LINENKWRAGRYGIDGRLIDFERKKKHASINFELLDFVDDVVDHLGSRHAINTVSKSWIRERSRQAIKSI
jgi:carboxylate-amine ligase